MNIELNYVGHSCFCIKKDENLILIDPFISQNPKAVVNFDLSKVNYIFVTHAHSDHLGDAIEISKKTGAKVYAIFELANYCTGKGASAVGVGLGCELKFDWGKVRFLPAFHSSSTPEGFYGGCASSVLFEFEDLKIYHAGDTSLNSELKLIGEVYNPDVSILPIGGQYTMNEEDAALAAKWLKSQTIIPMHYDTFDAIKANVVEFINLVEYTGQYCQHMQCGGKIEL